MKPIPKARAVSLSRLFSIMMLLEILVDDVSSSDVMSSIIAMTASQRLMSDMVSGKCKCMFSTFCYNVFYFDGFRVWRSLH